jgi:anti-anti-sigma factor
MDQTLPTVPDGIVVVLSGRLDSKNAAETLALIRTSISPGTKRVVFDLTALAFIASSGLGVLVQAAALAKANGGSAHHFGASPPIAQLLRIAGLSGIITPYQLHQGSTGTPA